MPITTCDPKSYVLAKHFLQDDDVSGMTPQQVEVRTMSLALAIQQAVEEWYEDEAECMQLAADEAEGSS